MSDKEVTPNHFLSPDDLIGLIVAKDTTYQPGYITVEEIRVIGIRAGFSMVVVRSNDTFLKADYQPKRLVVVFDNAGVIVNIYQG